MSTGNIVKDPASASTTARVTGNADTPRNSATALSEPRELNTPSATSTRNAGLRSTSDASMRASARHGPMAVARVGRCGLPAFDAAASKGWATVAPGPSSAPPADAGRAFPARSSMRKTRAATASTNAATPHQSNRFQRSQPSNGVTRWLRSFAVQYRVALPKAPSPKGSSSTDNVSKRSSRSRTRLVT